MDERRDIAIITLVFVAAACLAIFFLKIGHPTGAIFAMLFPQA